MDDRLRDRIAQTLHELVDANRGETRGAADMQHDAAVIVEVFRGGPGFDVAWRRIEDIPFGVKGSGSDLLLWIGGGAVVGYWSDSGPNAGEWLSSDDEIIRPTHYAQIQSPTI